MDIKMTPEDSKKRYKTNPFVADLCVPVKNRQVKVSPIGSNENVLINQSSGEVKGTHVTTYKKVDGEQFIKLFTTNIAMQFNLTSAGIKSLTVLVWAVQHKAITKDEVDLDSYSLDDFLNAHADSRPPLKLSLATFKRGLRELELSSIIAKTIRAGRYFINPNFVFNGDRIAFTTVIERNRLEEEQQELPLDI